MAVKYGEGNEDVSALDLTKLTPLALEQLRGALKVPAATDPAIEEVKEALRTMRLKIDSMGTQLSSVPASLSSLSQTSSSASEAEVQRLRLENDDLRERLQSAISEQVAKATSEAIDKATESQRMHLKMLQREKDHWMGTAQQLMEIKSTRKNKFEDDAGVSSGEKPHKHLARTK